MKKKLFTILQYIIFLGLGIFLAWWSLKDINREEKDQIAIALSHARYWLIIPVFAILFFSHLVRALRWKLLINSLDYYPRTDNAFFAVMNVPSAVLKSVRNAAARLRGHYSRRLFAFIRG